MDEAPVRLGITNDAATYPFCSFAGHTGVVQDRLLTHLPVYVSLGNTPFDRQMAFRQLAEQGIGSSAQQRLLVHHQRLSQEGFDQVLLEGRQRCGGQAVGAMFARAAAERAQRISAAAADAAQRGSAWAGS